MQTRIAHALDLNNFSRILVKFHFSWLYIRNRHHSFVFTTGSSTQGFAQMPVIMSVQKHCFKNNKHVKDLLAKEFNFLKNVFSVISLPTQVKEDNDDLALNFEMVSDIPQNREEKELPKRARSIKELEEKLEKIKSQNKFNLKNKLVKKTLNSKLHKKIKKKERVNKRAKSSGESITKQENKVEIQPIKNIASRPVFNNESKIVFSKFDFSNISHNGKRHGKSLKNPKRILENLHQQEQKMQENHDEGKIKELKEKMAWKNIFQKAEGQKVKDDPTLLKKSIKKMEQKKKQSKKQWDNRVSNVEQKKEDRQKKRKENISKKKKDKKSKIIKASAKRGRVVI